QVLQNLLHAFNGQSVLVAGLGRRQDIQIPDTLVLDQGLAQAGFAIDHIDEDVNHSALAVHDDVEVAHANIEVHHDRLVSAQGQPAADGRAGGGLANAALSRSQNNDSCHVSDPCSDWLMD